MYSSDRWPISLGDYIADLAYVVRQLPTPPILVGTSMGGMLVQKYLDRASMPAAVVVAPIPTRGLLPAALRYGARHPLILLYAILTLDPFQLVKTPRRYKEFFYSHQLPDSTLDAYFQRIEPESVRAFLELMIPHQPSSRAHLTPLLVVGAEQDSMFRPREIQVTAHAYHTQAQILPGGGHGLLLDVGLRHVADRILAWLQAQGL